MNTDLSYFNRIKPCGMDPEKITSMKNVLGHKVDFSEVKDTVVSKFVEVFGYDLVPPQVAGSKENPPVPPHV